MPMPKGVARLAAALFGIVYAATGLAWADLRPTEVFVSDPFGNPAPIRLGETFYAGVRYVVDAPTQRAYFIRFETAWKRYDTAPMSFGVDAPGEFTVVWGPFTALLDQPFELAATLDPQRRARFDDRRNNRISATFVPESSAHPIDRHAPRDFSARIALDLLWSSRSAPPQRVVVWMPMPRSEGSQEIAAPDLAPGFRAASSAPFGEPIAVSERLAPGLAPIHEESAFAVTAWSVRSNLTELRRSSFDDYAFAGPEVASWLQPETYVETGNPWIRRFAAQQLPADYRFTMTPVEAAQRLYRSVLARSTYTRKARLKLSAYATLRTKKGDCGGLSALFVALCRVSGIPARTVCGFTEGTNKWHVWAEFLVPGFGWVPVDPAYAEGTMPSGDLPIYFGTVPEMNARVATGYGFERAEGGLSLPMLQSPAAFWFGSNVRLGSLKVSSSLSPVP